MTSAPVVDERTHRAAAVTLVKAALGTEHVYDYGRVPGLDGNDGIEPDIYVILSVERRYVPPRRAGRAGRSGWRLIARAVGLTANEARWAMLRTTHAVEEKTLTVGGQLSTPVTHETSQAVEPDAGRYSTLRIWTYAL